MIEKPTTLVLGAGASSSYGLPLGSQLRANILEMLKDGTGLRRFVNMSGHRLESIDRFATRFRESEINSIDDFIAGMKQSDFVDIGRSVVALSILDAERKCNRDGVAKAGPADDHWMRVVWNAMHSGASKSEFGKNNLSIVTFNYDRTVETYFPRVISEAYDMELGEAEKLFERTVRILHVHGGLPKDVIFGDFPEHPVEEHLNHLRRSIRVIHDSDMAIDAAYDSACEIIAASERVCFLGFAFHRLNTRRLGLATIAPRNPSVFACMFGMGIAECERAEADLGVKIHNRGTGVKAAEYLRHGFVL